MSRHRSKPDLDALHKRIVELHVKDPELTQSMIAQRVGTTLDVVRSTCKAAGVPFEPRNVCGRHSRKTRVA